MLRLGFRKFFQNKSLKWNDAEDIAEILLKKNKQLDPLSLRFTQLHKLVTDLEEFKDDHNKSDESKLEKIQMAWLELKEE